MTASPFVGSRGVYESVQELEKILDAKAYTIHHELDTTLKEVVQRPNRMVVVYAPPQPSEVGPLLSAVDNSGLEHISEAWNKFIRQMHAMREELGRWYDQSQETNIKYTSLIYVIGAQNECCLSS
jgi:hypothetical protein